MTFSDDRQSVSSHNDSSIWSSCIYGGLITDKICNTFEIYFKFDAKDGSIDVVFGYIVNLDVWDKNDDWNEHIG